MQNFILEDMPDWCFPEVSRHFYGLKYREVEVTHMCRELQEYYEKAWQEGYREARLEARKEIIKELDKMGMPIEQIACIVKTPVETVSQWTEQQTEN